MGLSMSTTPTSKSIHTYPWERLKMQISNLAALDLIKNCK
jgi:hypothetical protein